MKLYGIAKTTLLDFPGHLSATLFLGGCNFLCPFCHNKSLVLLDPKQKVLDKNEILSFLKQRRNILEGVCITGGEPTLNKELPSFIKEIKSLGYKIKLDTNGSNSLMLEELFNASLIDYVAMDIKNSLSKYKITIGNTHFPIEEIQKSAALIKNSSIPYEFRTTITKELHTKEDMLEIGQWLRGSDSYYLQNFTSSPDQIQQGFSSHSKETLFSFQQLLKPYFNHVHLRGVE